MSGFSSSGGGNRQPADLQAILDKGIAAHRAGNLDVAAGFYREVLSHSKKQFAPLHLLGVIEGQRGNLAEGIRQITKAIKLEPRSPEAYLNLGRLQGESDDLTNAERNLRKSISLKADNPLAYSNLAAVLRRLRRLDEAVTCAQQAIELAPNDVNARVNHGNVLLDLQRIDDAADCYRQALSIDPNLAEAWNGIGNVELKLRHFAPALTAFQRAVATNPMLSLAWTGQANALGKLGRNDEAIASFDRAVTLDPKLAVTWLDRGQFLGDIGRYDQAEKALQQAINLKSSAKYTQGLLAVAKAWTANWVNQDAEWARHIASIQKSEPAIQPFTALFIASSARDQLKCAANFARETLPQGKLPLWRDERYAHEKIRIGYLSPDFRDHPVANLVVGMLEAHDRERFALTAFASGPQENSAMRARLEAAFDEFVDVDQMSDSDLAQAARDREIDILIDLAGFTTGSRSGALAYRPAPVQAGYLGYPGTMGSEFADYLIADRHVVPPDDRQFYAEQVVYLPDSYLPNDRDRAISDTPPQRAQENLPDDSLVFCVFNSTYKISPQVFDVWMNLLKQVEGSVLWLRQTNDAARQNLFNEAERRGVSASRLVFARRTQSNADHLARHRLADLFLDTLNYNAHSTACDALWAGLPVVTCAGSTFASRVGASVLNAAGLPELVTNSLQDYEALALRLAQDKALLAEVRAKLSQNRLTVPLFDTVRHTRHLEAAYVTMWTAAQQGTKPAAFAVEPL